MGVTMRSYRQWRAAVVLSLFFLSLLTACSKQETLHLKGDSSQQVVEIVVWDKPFSGQADKPYFDRMFKEFEKLYPNIRVIHLEAAYEKEREQFMTAVAGGEQPDLFNAAFPDMESYIDQGIPADITEMWEAYEDKDQFSSIAMSVATKDNRVYGIPNFMYVTSLLYNKRIFEEQGLNPDEAFRDWEAFALAAQTVTDRKDDRYGYAILGTEWADWFFEYYVWQAGGDLTSKNDDGTVELTFTSEAAVKALQYYKDLRFRYMATQPNVLQSLDDNKKDFYAGRAATMITTSNWFGEMIAAGLNMDDIGATMLPAGPSGDSLAQIGGGIWILNPNASEEKQKAAFIYATFIMSKYAVEQLLLFQKDNSSMPNLLSVRTDVDPFSYVEEMPEHLIHTIQDAVGESRLEYFLKARLSPYVAKAVQQVLLDEEADPFEVLSEAQELAQREVVDPYNSEIRMQTSGAPR
ncbi:extracellular solute-binding protein [Paenibacillus lactis]|uniref:extracellular solute-binding protein n=1 Tax=Paenibacillus lactis TaxID=228574 RepID=UPI0021B6684F